MDRLTFLFSRNNTGEGYKSKYRCCTCTHSSRIFPTLLVFLKYDGSSRLFVQFCYMACSSDSQMEGIRVKSKSLPTTGSERCYQRKQMHQSNCRPELLVMEGIKHTFPVVFDVFVSLSLTFPWPPIACYMFCSLTKWFNFKRLEASNNNSTFCPRLLSAPNWFD